MLGIGFKNWLLMEQQEYLAHQVASVLTAVQEMVAGGKQVGAKQLMRNSEIIATRIRRILHSSWPRSENKHLRVLQKCGVAILRAIDEKGDLREALTNVQGELERLTKKIGQPVNHLAVPNKENVPSNLKPDQQQQQMAGPEDEPRPSVSRQDQAVVPYQ